MARTSPPRAIGATFNLLNTILGGGGGIVPLPRCVRLTGLRIAPALLISCAALSAYSACALVTTSCIVRARTYQGVARRTIGRNGATTVQVLIVCLTFGISVAVIDIFADVVPSLLHLSRTTTVVLAGGTVTPIVALVRRIERLAVISVAASALVAAFVCFVCLHHFVSVPNEAEALPAAPTTSAVLEASSIVNLSFLCHFNLLPLFQSLSSQSQVKSSQSLPDAPTLAVRHAMFGVILIATLLALLVYASVGVLGFLAFREHTSGNAFADYATVGRTGRALNNAIAAAQLISLPLLVHEGVCELVELLGACGAGEKSGRDVLTEQRTLLGSALPRVDSDGELVVAGEAPGQAAARRERLCGAVWCAAATCVAIYAADTSKVLALVAALCGAPLMSVLPLVMLLRSNHRMGPAGVVLNVALLALGAAVTAASAISAVSGAFAAGS